MRRTKREVAYWTDRMDRLFREYPDTKSVKNRYLTIKVMLQGKYPEIKDNPRIKEMLKDAIWLDRKIRWMTEGEETTEKAELEFNKQQELGYYPK